MTDNDFAAYAKIDAINWSTLKEMAKSPKHYQHALANARKDTAAMALGRAVHTAVFEPDRFALEYAVWKGDRRAGKTWEAFKAMHAKETILKVDEYRKCIAIRDAVRSHPTAARYLADGVGEQTISWTDKGTGLACKARYDWYSRAAAGGRGALVDLKTASDIEARAFARTVARLAYYAQLSMYADGLADSVGHDPEVVIIAVESNAPHDVAVFNLDADALYAGREHYRDLLARVKGCREFNHWPGRYVEKQSLELPPWAFGDTESITDDDDIVFGKGA
jgi:hypothetical protein